MPEQQKPDFTAEIERALAMREQARRAGIVDNETIAALVLGDAIACSVIERLDRAAARLDYHLTELTGYLARTVRP